MNNEEDIIDVTMFNGNLYTSTASGRLFEWNGVEVWEEILKDTIKHNTDTYEDIGIKYKLI